MKVYSNYRFSITNNEETYKEPTLKALLYNNEVLVLYLLGIPIISILLLSMFYCIPIWFIYQGIEMEFLRNIIELTYMIIFTFVPIITIYFGVKFGVDKIKIFKSKILNIISFIVPTAIVLSIGYFIKMLILSLGVLAIIGYMYVYFINRRYSLLANEI